MANHNHLYFVCKSGIIIFLVNLLGIALCAPTKADGCNSSIEELRNYINSEGGLVNGFKFEIDSTSPYGNAKYMAMIGLESKPKPRMGGTATLEQDIKNKAFLNSPQSIRPYAVKIIRNCENVFRAGVYGHEFGVSYALHPDSSIRLDECAPRGMNMPYPLGYTYCG